MAISTVVLNTITDDSEKAKPFGFEVANNNSISTKSNSGNPEWLELLPDKLLYGSPSGIILVDKSDIAPFKRVTPSGYSKGLILPSNQNDDSLLLGHDYENSSTPFDNNSGNTYNTVIFDMDKGVFRIGRANTEFNDSNCGIGSIAFGQGNYASGINAKAFGDANNISDTGSIAIGNSNNVSDTESVTIGVSNTVDVSNAIVLGRNNNTNGHTGYILGENITKLEDNGTAIGKRFRNRDALIDFTGYSGVFTSGRFFQSTNGYIDLFINDESGSNTITGIEIDTTKTGMLNIQAIVGMLDDDGTTEYRIRRLYAIFSWSAGDASLTIVTRTSQSVTGSGSTHNARFNRDGKVVSVQVDPDNDKLKCLANVEYTIGYFN